MKKGEGKKENTWRASLFGSLAELTERSRAVRYLVYGGIALLALILFMTSGGARSCTKESGTDGAEADPETAAVRTDGADLESRLEAILSGMAGVGKVRVMLTLESTEERILAMNERSASQENGETTESRPATASSGGKESPIVLTELLPRVRGVIVVAEGAANIGVRLNIAAAVSTVLGIDESRVEVFVMAAGGAE